MYGADDSESMMCWFVRSLEGVCRDTQVSVGSCPISNDTDVRHTLALGNGGSLDVTEDWQGTLIHRIETMAAFYPQSTALVDGYGHRLKYCEMIDRAYRIARHICASSSLLVTGSCLGVLLDHGADQVCTLLAILRLGLVYVPLDLRNPHGRLYKMVSDCRSVVLVFDNMTKDVTVRLALKNTAQVVNIDDYDSSSLHKGTAERIDKVQNSSSPDQTAIILYTSGSTGVPKGVLLSHANIMNHIFVN